MRCTHSKLSFEPSPHSEETGYRRPDNIEPLSTTFPGPLILPGDYLVEDPNGLLKV